MSADSATQQKLEFVPDYRSRDAHVDGSLFFSAGTIFGIGNPLLDISAEVQTSFLEK